MKSGVCDGLTSQLSWSCTFESIPIVASDPHNSAVYLSASYFTDSSDVIWIMSAAGGANSDVAKNLISFGAGSCSCPNPVNTAPQSAATGSMVSIPARTAASSRSLCPPLRYAISYTIIHASSSTLKRSIAPVVRMREPFFRFPTENEFTTGDSTK